MRLRVQIVNAHHGEVVWTRDFVRGAASPAEIDDLAATVARVMGQTYGIVFADLRRRMTGPPALGFECVIAANAAVAHPSRDEEEKALGCLQASITRDPSFSSAYYALSNLLVSNYLEGWRKPLVPDPIGRALDLAHQGVMLAPEKGRAHATLFWAEFIAGRADDAFESARAAMERNPLAADTIARVGVARIITGDYDEGARLLKDAATHRRWTPGWEEFFLFLDARQRGEPDRARKHALRASTAAFPLSLLARIIVDRAAGDDAGEQAARARLRVAFPDCLEDLDGCLARWRLAPDLRAGLVTDVAETDASTAARTR